MFTRPAAFLLCAFTATTALAAPDTGSPERTEEDDSSIATLVWENDIFGGTDENYTNGIRFGWLSSEANAPYWVRTAADVLPLAAEGNKRISITLGQSMFTPNDDLRYTLDQDDRPYAGWLYGSLGVVSDTGHVLDNVMLTLGMVGPSAYAEQTQDTIHSLKGVGKFNGWDNQLHDEPGIVLTYERKWRNMYQLSPFGFGFDATPHVGVNLGNVFTDASTGVTFRLGQDLPADYGPPRIRPSVPGSDFFIPSKDIGWYLFAGLEGRAVARNIFLDGNTFRDSHHVEKENFVGGLQTGIAFTYGDVRLSYTHAFYTREFEKQQNPAQFGIISLSYRF